MKLEELGWSERFYSDDEKRCRALQKPARIIVVDRDRYLIKNEYGELSAILAGKFRYFAHSSTEYPCVGDWVCTQSHDFENTVTIQSVLPRYSYLRRKSAGKNIEYQMIGANIDVALIVQSCHFDFNVRRLERYLVMVNEGNVEPVLILSKADLISPQALEQLILKIQNAGININIIALSNVTGAGVDQIRDFMISGKTYCLVGSSGVGKTTLINQLIGHAELMTKTVSSTGEGRHTTVRRQLIVLEQGAMLIDTPGMRELGILGGADGIDESYSDILKLSEVCRFADCGHTNEPGCAVQEALTAGTLDQEHYNNYMKIKRESAFYEMSYMEKRKKDKEFGRFVRSVLKDKDKYR